MENSKGGRPRIGNIVSVALGDTLPGVDTYAQDHGLNRAAAVRSLITKGLTMTTTTEYGTWNNHGDDTSLTVETTVFDYIANGDSEWADRCNTSGALENMVAAYRAAINAALPGSVSLAGNDFYGPYYEADQHFDGYPANEDGGLDIAAIIQGVDLGEIVAEHDPDNK